MKTDAIRQFSARIHSVRRKRWGSKFLHSGGGAYCSRPTDTESGFMTTNLSRKNFLKMAGAWVAGAAAGGLGTTAAAAEKTARD